MGFLVSRTCNIVANVVKMSWGCQGIIVKEVKIFIFEYSKGFVSNSTMQSSASKIGIRTTSLELGKFTTFFNGPVVGHVVVLG
jgi:hypothetical protein